LDDPWENFWQAGSDDDPRPRREPALPNGTWLTTFLPPPDFTGYQNIEWNGWDWYERTCTPEEAALIDSHDAAAAARERAELTAGAEAERDSFFAKLRGELMASAA